MAKNILTEVRSIGSVEMYLAFPEESLTHSPHRMRLCLYQHGDPL